MICSRTARSLPRRTPLNGTFRMPPSVPRASVRAAAKRPAGVGHLPEWNLADLYPGMDAPAVKRDLDRADTECAAFADAYKGKLAVLATSAEAGGALAEAVKRYEAIDDLLGRLISFASLVYAENTTDPPRAKFYGDVQEPITAPTSHFLCFTLELTRLDDALTERARAEPTLGHSRPCLEDIRKEKPYQLEDRVELLF